MAKKTVRKSARKKGRGGARKGAGRPVTLGDAKFIGAMWPGAMVERLDRWRGQQPDKPKQSEAVRLLLDQALKAAGY